MTIKKSYVSELKIWIKRSNFLRPAFYDDDNDDDDDACALSKPGKLIRDNPIIRQRKSWRGCGLFTLQRESCG